MEENKTEIKESIQLLGEEIAKKDEELQEYNVTLSEQVI